MPLRNSQDFAHSLLKNATNIRLNANIPSSCGATFNPLTGSWVYGLAAFAAGVAVKKFAEKAGQQMTGKAEGVDSEKEKQHVREEMASGRMDMLLRDTMAEEARSMQGEQGVREQVQQMRAEIERLKMERDSVSSGAGSMTDSALLNDVAQLQTELEQLKNQRQFLDTAYRQGQNEDLYVQSRVSELEAQISQKNQQLSEASQNQEQMLQEQESLKATMRAVQARLDSLTSGGFNSRTSLSSTNVLQQSHSALVEQLEQSEKMTRNFQQQLDTLSQEVSMLKAELQQSHEKAIATQQRLHELEQELMQTKEREQKLLQELDRLSSQQFKYSEQNIENIRLEQDLVQANADIAQLKDKLDEKSDFAAKNEQILTQKINDLMVQVQKLEAERITFSNQNVASGNALDQLQRSILTLESEKKSLIFELEKAKSQAESAQRLQEQAHERVDFSSQREEELRAELLQLKQQIQDAKLGSEELRKKSVELQHAEKQIKEVLQQKNEREHQLAAAQSELSQLREQINELSLKKSLLGENNETQSRLVAELQMQLNQKSDAIQRAQAAENVMRSEQDVLKKTIVDLENEIQRIRTEQQHSVVGGQTIQLLQNTEKSLREELNNAQVQLREQRELLSTIQNEYNLIAANKSHESEKLNALQFENEQLLEKLTSLEARDSNKMRELDALQQDAQQHRELEQELHSLRAEHAQTVQMLEQSDLRVQKYETQLRALEQEFVATREEKEQISSELDATKDELAKLSRERDQLQSYNSKLEKSIQDLKEEHQNTEKLMILTDEEEDKVVSQPTTRATAIPEKKSNVLEFAPLEPVQTVEQKQESAEQELPVEPDGEVFFESASSSGSITQELSSQKMRKFRDFASNQRDLNDGKKLDQSPRVKRKVHSPDRSFMDLMEDSERLRMEKDKAQDVDQGWEKIEEIDNEDYSGGSVSSGSGGLKKVMLAGLMIGTIGGVGAALYHSGMQGENKTNAPVTSPVNSNGSNGSGGQQVASQENKAEAASPVVDQEKVKKELLEVMTAFHRLNSNDKRASLCRNPNRTLRDMKAYYMPEARESFTISSVYATQSVSKGKKQMIRAELLDSNGEQRVAYFEKDKEGYYLLDWYHYVDFEPVPWDKFLELGSDGTATAQEWHVEVMGEAEPHPSLDSAQHRGLILTGWNKEHRMTAYAYLEKTHPKYGELEEAIKTGNKYFILKIKHMGDIANSLIVEDIISTTGFFENDILEEVSSLYDDLYPDGFDN